jgi:hypothetical protein
LERQIEKAELPPEAVETSEVHTPHSSIFRGKNVKNKAVILSFEILQNPLPTLSPFPFLPQSKTRFPHQCRRKAISQIH